MPKRPALNKQPPKRILRKTEAKDISMGDTFAVADIAMAFRRLKASFLNKMDDFDKKADDIIEDVKTRTDKELSDAKVKLDKEAQILSNQITVTREHIVAKVDQEISKTDSLLKEKTNGFVSNFFKDLKKTMVEEFNQSRFDIVQTMDHARSIKKGDKGDPGDQGDPGKAGIDAVLDTKVFKALIKQLPEGFLKIKHIKGLEEALRDLSNKASTAIQLGGEGGAGGGQGSWKQKNLSGTIDGANTTFTFTGDPPAEFSERLFLNYIEQNPFTDYNLSNPGGVNTIEYTVAPDISLSGFPHIIRFM